MPFEKEERPEGSKGPPRYVLKTTTKEEFLAREQARLRLLKALEGLELSDEDEEDEYEDDDVSIGEVVVVRDYERERQLEEQRQAKDRARLEQARADMARAALERERQREHQREYDKERAERVFWGWVIVIGGSLLLTLIGWELGSSRS